ncbi:vWA domain-containing protein [Paenibacillus daejeonensis]|uniref:vWA domain-containing protein n=1 Tax=Paenibacillus daejeonensis TaxID=135193 RepID=UPI0003772FA2|nr:VWA domain-containing protein [Paenibacillus daejeonensis]
MRNRLLKITKTKLALAAAALALMLAGAGFIFFLGDGEAVDPKEQTVSVLSGRTGSYEPVKERPARLVYPIGAWDTAVPYINPFGSQSSYRSAAYLANQQQELRYIDLDNRETSRLTAGEKWELEVEWTDQGADPIDDLIAYAVELDSSFYRGVQEGQWIIHARDQEETDWWAIAAEGGSGYRLTVYKELRLQPGQTVTAGTGDYDTSELYFVTNNENLRYQSLKVSLDKGQLQLTGKGSYVQGQYRRDLSYTRTLDAVKTRDYVLGDLPQDPSVPLLWKMTWSASSDPGEIAITLDEKGELQPIRDGERLGALKVRGAQLGHIKVEASPGVALQHPELSLMGDQTPEGDTLFWLPPGYWNVVVEQDGRPDGNAPLRTRLIPVSSGEMTELDMKPLIVGSYRTVEMGDASGADSELKIESVSEQGDTAIVRFMLLDAQNRQFVPTVKDVEILEGGQPGKLVKLERLETPPSVVLALDSSGSMAKSMTQVLSAARSFIEGLPDHTYIRVIDFDSQVQVLEGTTKQEVLAGLSQVKAKGNTTLYDAIIRGVELLKEKERPTVVVFSDGVDSDVEKAGTGSKASKEEVMQTVQASGIPLYTIGFGPGHDASTLLELAALSDGTYYAADDTEALNHVFLAIRDRLGNRFEATYQRPNKQAPSDVSVVSLTLDVSGSMDVEPESGNGAYRLDKMKALFHEFISQKPDSSLMQLVSFSSEISFEQMFTNRKPELLQSLGMLRAGGGTDIFSSTDRTYNSLSRIPSDKRVIVYLTDAALDVELERKAAFETLLTRIKEEGIQVLWVGLGTEDGEEAFRWAAEKSGGSYVISEDPAVLSEAFNAMLAKVEQQPAEKVALSLSITSPAADGETRVYDANTLADFPLQLSEDNKAVLQTISYEPGGKIAQYETGAASLLYGSDLPGQEVKILKRIPLDAETENKAMAWSARELLFLKRLGGVDAPAGRSFVAVDMELGSTQAKGAAYVIPDFASHFFLETNGMGSYPASTTTWLAEAPLAPPGESSVTVKSGESVRGILVFLVPDERMEQAALHFYDTNNGHLTLPLIGRTERSEIALTALPTTAEGKLSDTFRLKLTAASEQDTLGPVQFKPQTSLFKVVEGDLTSAVQSRLKFDPQQRFYLRMTTGKGPFLVPVHTGTALLPHGLLRPVTLAPGSTNKIRLAFQIPAALQQTPSELYVDLFGVAAILPVGGKAQEAGQPAAGETVYQGQGVKLRVHALSRIQDIESSRGDYVVADVTLMDAADGNGVSGFRDTFRLIPEGREEADGLRPDEITDELVFGMDQDWSVFDGTSRRGLLVFALPEGSGDRAWNLRSELFGELSLPVGQNSYPEPGLLVKHVTLPQDKAFDIALSTALTEAIRHHRARVSADAERETLQLAVLDEGRERPEQVPAPLPVLHGLWQLSEVKTMEAMQSLLEEVRWLPSSDPYYAYRHSPEAVLTQGWGTEGDLARLTGGLLARLGATPSLRKVKLTEEGKQALLELSGAEEVKAEYLPAWSYEDEAGEARIFVVPFMRDLSELGGLLYYPGAQDVQALTTIERIVSVSYLVIPQDDQGVGGITGSIGDVLGGGGGESEPAVEEIRVLDAALRLDQLGNEPLDIRAGASGELYTAILENETFQLIGKQAVDISKNTIVGVRVEVQLPGEKRVHETMLKPGESIDGVFHTIAINLPDLPEPATDTLQRAADRDYSQAGKPDDASALRWYTRNIIYRFVTNQTAYERELADSLDVVSGRTDKERVIVVTVRRPNKGAELHTSIDLQQTASRLHAGSEEAKVAFQIASGLFASRLEGVVLSGKQTDFMDIWLQSPEDTQLFLSLYSNRQADLTHMEEMELPEILIERARTSMKAFLVPDQPSMIGGEARWAWLEIDPVTYETISVLDTGEHGGFAEYLMQLERVSPVGDDYLAFMAGAFIGVSSAVWSVGAYALELDDYEQIINAAKMYTYGLGEVLGAMMSNKDLPKLEYSISPLKLKLVNREFDYLAKRVEKVKMGKRGDYGADIVGFAQGFKAGAAYYFQQAEPPKQEKPGARPGAAPKR